ncbi:MAG TPA: imidazoleglycerol-phosphate dehydratase, partial [Methanoregula sp.]|nr:imidazoleglycerol-phosphate dehydratase [Methanoregula sp.]
YSLCTRAGITAHVAFSGKNDHHQCEALFKAFGIALGQALSMSGDKKMVRSTKGTF